MTYEPLHHKYRPQTFADLVGQEAIATTLTNAIRTERIAPAYLFTGSRGTGKTSSARILAKSLNCLKGNKPTEQPCGVCDVCQGITKGSTLDVIEIDAASNTGVDNIREIIERAQFAPVQCRYKVYVIDECLTGDSLVQTSEGQMRIDDPKIKGKRVLSYNDSLETWEFKKVVRWLDQGVRQTLVIKTTNRDIKCTGNHLIRTDRGWVPAKNVKAGAKILSPVNVDATPSLTSKVERDVSPKRHTTGMIFSPWLNHFAPTRPVQIGGNIQFHQWNTSLEIVESVQLGKVERVYDIEVQKNHNFVANGLLIHNCHMLSSAAFNALLKTLEEPPNRVVFVLATTDPQRVLPTIISRCQKFDFRRIPLQSMVTHLKKIARAENINITDEAMTLVAQVAQGGLRDAESLLDQLSLLAGEVTVERIWDLVGAVPERDLMELVSAIASHNPEAILERSRNLMDRGREPLIVLQNLAGFYRDLLIAKTAPNRKDLVAVTAPTWTAMCEFVKSWDTATLLKGQRHLKDSEVQIKNTTQPRLWLEVTLLGLLPSGDVDVVGRRNQSGQGIDFKSSQKNPAESNRHSTTHQQQNASPIAPESKEANKTASPPHLTPQEPAPVQPENLDPSPSVPQPAANVLAGQHAAHSSPNIAAASEQLEAESQVPSQQPDLNQIWQKLLVHLPLPSRALFSEHGRLLAVNEREARIAIRAPKLVKMAQTKLADIEVAFLKAFNQKVRVNLAPSEPNGTPIASVKPLPDKSTYDSESVVASPGIASPYSTEPHLGKVERQQVQEIGKSSSTNSPLPPSSEVKEQVKHLYPATPLPSQVSSFVTSDSRVEFPKASSTTELTLTPAQETGEAPRPTDPKVPDLREDEVAIATRSFAKYFEAAIINLTDELDKNAEQWSESAEPADTHKSLREDMMTLTTGLQPDTDGTSVPFDDEDEEF